MASTKKYSISAFHILPRHSMPRYKRYRKYSCPSIWARSRPKQVYCLRTFGQDSMGITSYRPGSQIALSYLKRRSVFNGLFFFLCLICLPKIDFYALFMGLYCQILVHIITIHKKMLACRSIQRSYLVELISLNIQQSPIFWSFLLFKST